jgi:sialic acid synthase SpsE
MDYGLSVWDTKSAEAAFGAPFLDFVKIPSPRVMHQGIRQMAIRHRNRQKPIFLSDGMSTVDEMRSALLDLTSMGVSPILMHCTSSYPTAMEHENLSNILEDYGYPVQAHGYSTHAIRMEPILAATALGASAIEMHVTLSHNLPGSDQNVSWEFEAANHTISRIRAVALSVGKPVVKQVKPCEESAREKLWRTEDVSRGF